MRRPESFEDLADGLVRALSLLKRLEFDSDRSRCRCCGGHNYEDWGWVDEGPDRGHAKGCALRVLLDDWGVH